MTLGTVDRTPPPFFRQGPSALSKLLVLSALAVLLMVVDVRLRLSAPLRATVSVALYPLQWVAIQPVEAARWVGDYFGSLRRAQLEADEAEAELARQVQRAAQLDFLTQENRQLRELLDMRQRPGMASARGAEVLYEAADPFSRKVVIDRGMAHGVGAGSPVMDGYGVLGQVTRALPMTAEVTLLIDRNQAIPVLNTRTGQRSLAYGVADGGHDRLELRFVATNADVEPGDLLTTSGVDGVYPAGLPVATVLQVERLSNTPFARIVCEPKARMDRAIPVLVLPATTAPPSTGGAR